MSRAQPGIGIGVFVCHCGTNIGGVIDVPAVVEYAKTLPNVVYAEHNLYLCSESGLSSIRNKIKEQNLNRVVVASCTPRTHEPLFKRTCEQAGLNKYLFEFVNIREQCSWIHMHQPKEATEKAKILIRMGVAKTATLEPQQDFFSPVIPVGLVIGGGVAGLTAAINLASQGFRVHLVERESELGGLLRVLNTLFPDNRDAREFVKALVTEVQNSPNIIIHLKSQIKTISGYIGNFESVITDEMGKESRINAGTIIVATGSVPFMPHGLFRYGELKNVLTQLELEEELRAGRCWNDVVMINCVGARTPERKYCSKICCPTALKNAILLKERKPDANVWILYRDIMATGTELERMYRKALETGVRFVCYDATRLPEVIGELRARCVRVFDRLLGEELELKAELVVLSTPLIPQPWNDELAKMLKVPCDESGFFLEAHIKLRPVEFATEGIFVAGTARWPASVDEAVSQGYACAAKAAIPMRRGQVVAEALTAEVDETRCIGCGNCVQACPYNAIELVCNIQEIAKKARVNAALCKGCGCCAAACPNGTIRQRGFTNVQILDMINALVDVQYSKL